MTNEILYNPGNCIGVLVTATHIFHYSKLDGFCFFNNGDRLIFITPVKRMKLF